MKMEKTSAVADSYGAKKPKLKYPKSIAFIISNEFCERFNYYGMRTILSLYLVFKLGYPVHQATVLFHIFSSMVYFFPILGAILADSVLGKFRTIVYLSIVYVIGTIMISIGAVPVLPLPQEMMTIAGLLLIAIGTGGIKPCVSAFGGDQFKVPEQAKQLATFFSLFYFSINAGSLISTTLTPLLRADVGCFGDLDCFSLAFGVPGVLMIASVVIFVMGKRLYVIKKPTGNMIVLVSKCITNALSVRSSERSSTALPTRDHWLDYAEPRYGKQLVADVKALLKILVLYLPLPVFWALFDQQGSRWTFQATQMNGNLGPFAIKPDQMQVVNPLLILIFIPLFDYFVYPLLSKIGIRRPLQKLTLGGILAGIAFLMSGFVELQLEKTYPVLPLPSETHIHLFNGGPCEYSLDTTLPNVSALAVPPFGHIQWQHVRLLSNSDDQTTDHQFTANFSGRCANETGDYLMTTLRHGNVYSLFVNRSGIVQDKLNVGRSTSGKPSLTVLVNRRARMLEDGILLRGDHFERAFNSGETEAEMAEGDYRIQVDAKNVGATIALAAGGVYTLIVTESDQGELEFVLHTITAPNSVHMMWLIPQYVVITAGEVMFSVTGLEFSFTQAPASMKSVIQACWLLTVAVGNLIVVAIAEVRAIDQQSSEFFLFAILMFIDMGLFVLLALRYRYADTTTTTAAIAPPVTAANRPETIHVKALGLTNEGFRAD